MTNETFDPAEFEQPTYDPQIFFDRYWRRKPLFVRGGAGAFLGRTWTASMFDDACANARAQAAEIKERAGEVTFIERISAYDRQLGRAALEFREMFAVTDAWFDGVRTYTSSGIGAHFDHSDNFVLQQSGVKRWTLESPKRLDPSSITRRMLTPQAGVDCPTFSGEKVNFTLAGGDLLYIPLFWIHEGVSEADSISLSLVIPALSVYSAVVPLMNIVLKKLGMGYEPVPVLHAYLSADQRQAAWQELLSATRHMIASTGGAEVARLIEELQAKHIPGVYGPSPLRS